MGAVSSGVVKWPVPQQTQGARGLAKQLCSRCTHGTRIYPEVHGYSVCKTHVNHEWNSWGTVCRYLGGSSIFSCVCCLCLNVKSRQHVGYSCFDKLTVQHAVSLLASVANGTTRNSMQQCKDQIAILPEKPFPTSKFYRHAIIHTCDHAPPPSVVHIPEYHTYIHE